MAKTKDRVIDRAGEVKPYIDRAMHDEDLRDNVMTAFAAAREVYDELRQAADRVQGKKDHGGRNSTLLLAGITLGILFNPITGPQTRKWISDKIFGSSDDFTYSGDSSTTGTGSGSNGS